MSAQGFEQETKTCTVLSNKAATLKFELKRMRVRGPRRTVNNDDWPRDRISNEADYSSEDNRRRGQGRNDNLFDDYNHVDRRGFYNQGNRANDEFPVRRNYPHPK